MENKSKDEIRNTLKESLKGFLDDDNIPIENGSLLQKPSDESYIEQFDNKETETKNNIKAKKLITTMLKMFMSEELLTKSEFLQAKSQLDMMSISQILTSLKQIEYTIEIILRDIGFGNTQPRMFEVFGQLQKTKVELIREYNSMLIMFEENMRRYKQDLEFLNQSKSKTNINLNTNMYRGNKDLMRSIQDEIKNSDKPFIEDDEDSEDSEDSEIIDFDDDIEEIIDFDD